MPLYEYECQTDGSRFEVIQKFSDPPVDVCPSCGGPVKRLLSSPAIQFKGSGWYITDYAKKGSTDSGQDSRDSRDSKESKDGKPASSTSGDTSTAKPAAPAASTTTSSEKSEK